MTEPEASDWLSGLVSNSSANSSQNPNVSTSASHPIPTVLPQTNNLQPNDIKQPPDSPLSEGDTMLVRHVTELLKSISLTPTADGGIVGNASRQPIFFSTVHTNTGRMAINQSTATWSSEVTSTNSILGDENQKAKSKQRIEEKVRAMLYEGGHIPEQSITQEARGGPQERNHQGIPSQTNQAPRDTRSSIPIALRSNTPTNETYEENTSDNTTVGRPADLSLQPASSQPSKPPVAEAFAETQGGFASSDLYRRKGDEMHSDAELLRVELLERKCRAQELLIGTLYKDLLASEEQLSVALSARAVQETALKGRMAEWERERNEWASECARLAQKLQTTVKSQPTYDLSGSGEDVCGDGCLNRKALSPPSPFVGFDGARKTFVSMHEELHYTKGYNRALRDEIQRLKDCLAEKEDSLVRMSDQLRAAYRVRSFDALDEGQSDGAAATRSALCGRAAQSPLKGGSVSLGRRQSRGTPVRRRSSSQCQDDPLVQCILGLLTVRERHDHGSGHCSSRRGSRSNSVSTARKPSPFRNTL